MHIVKDPANLEYTSKKYTFASVFTGLNNFESKSTPVNRLDFYCVPVGTIARFQGAHIASDYLVKKISIREIIVNHCTDYRRLAIGPLDALVSFTPEDLRQGRLKGGVLILGENYYLPYFNTPGEGEPIDYKYPRVEPYNSILVLRP